MFKFKQVLVSLLLMVMPMQIMAVESPKPNMAPIISYLLSDSKSEFDVKTYFESGTKYFATQNTTMGERTLDGAGNYEGKKILGNGTIFDPVNGTYEVSDNIITFTTSTDVVTVLTYISPTISGKGRLFSATVNGGSAFLTSNYDTSDERDAYLLNVETYYESGRKYFAAQTGVIGDREVDGEGNYTGEKTLADGKVFNIDGTYTISNNIITFTATSNGLDSVLIYLSPTNSGTGRLFLGTYDGGDMFFTSNYDTEQERNASMLDVEAYFEEGTKYFASQFGTIGERTIDSAGNYTGKKILANGTVVDPVTGTYQVSGNSIMFTTSGGDVIILTYISPTGSGSGRLFSITINDGAPFLTINYDSASERDNYMSLSQ